MGGVSYCYAIVSAASSGLRYTPPPCACERLVTFVLQRTPIGAECAIELSRRGWRELFLCYRRRRFERLELLNHCRRRRGRGEISLRYR
jgi:hypothetical protein